MTNASSDVGKELTEDELLTRYLERATTQCPRCLSPKVDWGTLEAEDTDAARYGNHCQDCGLSWTEYLTVTSISIESAVQ